MTDLDIARGRKEILSLLRVLDWGTVRKWKRQHSLPLRYLPNGQPFLIPREVKTWMVKYSELSKKINHRKTNPISTP